MTAHRPHFLSRYLREEKRAGLDLAQVKER
jgi:hypothetical protein